MKKEMKTLSYVIMFEEKYGRDIRPGKQKLHGMGICHVFELVDDIYHDAELGRLDVSRTFQKVAPYR